MVGQSVLSQLPLAPLVSSFTSIIGDISSTRLELKITLNIMIV
eukprot:UN07107